MGNKNRHIQEKSEYTKKMRKTHTILMPSMLSYHNELLKAAFIRGGYRFDILPEYSNQSDYALPYLCGDYCLPMVLILGQMLGVLKNGQYAPDKVAFMEPQTGGACRAGNYYNSIISAMKKAGYEQIPVISLNAFGKERHSGFTITPRLAFATVAAVCYGDLLLSLKNQLTPCEQEKGAVSKKVDYWTNLLCEEIMRGSCIFNRKKMYRRIVEDFMSIPTQVKKRTKVGITGEIFMKYSQVGNRKIEETLKSYDCEYRISGFMNYCIYIVDSECQKSRLTRIPHLYAAACKAVIRYMMHLQKDIYEVMEEHQLTHDAYFNRIKENATGIISTECNTGDGWLVAGEVVDLIEQGCDKILILHPFGCLVSHVCERGILKALHEKYPEISIHTLEYDYDSTDVLLESRIMMGIL